MSRTLRLKSERWLEKDALNTWVRLGDRYQKIKRESSSKEGRKILAELHSDSKKHFYDGKGPNWFHNLTVQRPYRRDAAQQIKVYFKNPDYEIQIRNKPYRKYWD